MIYLKFTKNIVCFAGWQSKHPYNSQTITIFVVCSSNMRSIHFKIKLKNEITFSIK